MKVVSNEKVYDLRESIVASGYPMKANITIEQGRAITDKDMHRAESLNKATLTGNTAHNQFMTGIRVSFDLTFSNKAWVEAERYRFLEFVSSQSTMHRIIKFNLDNSYNSYVDKRIIEIMKELVSEYNALPEDAEIARKIMYLRILYSNPSGFVLTARMTTNYRCLRNIYKQRKDHRLPEWREFCEWIETLPYAEELLIN